MASLLFGAPPMVVTLSSRISFAKFETLGQGFSSYAAYLSIAPLTLHSLPSVYCGGGNKRTAKGKHFNHSFGNARPRNKKKGRGPPRVPVPPAPPRKDKFNDSEVVKIEIDESLFSK